MTANHVELLLADAELAGREGDWPAARRLAEAALVLRPDDPHARRVLRGAQTAIARAGERRPLTVLASSAVGAAVLAAIERYDGHVVSSVDGVVAYFGYPTTHENDPERAILAGLELLEANPTAAVGIDTGVVVRSGIDDTFGAPRGMATSLRDEAAPGTVVVSAAVEELARSAFSCEPAGDAFVVRAADVARTPPPSGFCNRVAELAQLEDAWAVPGAVLLVGEPGIGKSRLADEFRLRIEVRGALTATTACSVYHSSTELYPVRRLLQNAGPLGSGPFASVLADLLRTGPRADLDGPRFREVAMSGLVDLLQRAAAAAPTLIVLDDVQWADPTTTELVTEVIRRRIDHLVLLLTAREGFDSPWNVPLIRVGRMHESDMRRLAAVVPGAHDIAEPVVAEAIERSEGVPLFLEELLRSVGTGPVPPTLLDTPPVPAALVGRLLARLAAPGVDLGLCQAIAAIGREADGDVIAALMGVPDADLAERLRVLVEARLVVPISGPGFRFCHELMRDLAYETLLLPERRKLHSAIADILEALAPAGVPGDSGAIAHHLEKAGRIAGAIDAYIAGARASLGHGAMAEAIDQLDLCLKLLDEVPDPRRRDGLELAVRQVRGMAWVSSQGYAALAAVEDFRRCVELAPTTPGPALEAVWYFHLLRGELEIAERIPQRMPIEGSRGPIRFFRGDFPGAVADMAAFVESSWAASVTDWALPDDPIVNTLSFAGLARWITGDPAGSRRAFARAVERASLLPFPHGAFGTAYVRQLQIITARIGNLDAEADERIDELAALADRHGFGFFSMSAAGQRIVSDVRRGGPLASLEAVIAGLGLAGIDIWQPFFDTELGFTALRDGLVDEAARYAEAAIHSPTPFLAAEGWRLRGLASGSAADLERAADVAHAQGARLFELRALLSLADPARLRPLVASMADVQGLPELDDARGRLGYELT